MHGLASSPTLIESKCERAGLRAGDEMGSSAAEPTSCMSPRSLDTTCLDHDPQRSPGPFLSFQPQVLGALVPSMHCCGPQLGWVATTKLSSPMTLCPWAQEGGRAPAVVAPEDAGPQSCPEAQQHSAHFSPVLSPPAQVCRRQHATKRLCVYCYASRGWLGPTGRPHDHCHQPWNRCAGSTELRRAGGR